MNNKMGTVSQIHVPQLLNLRENDNPEILQWLMQQKIQIHIA